MMKIVIYSSMVSDVVLRAYTHLSDEKPCTHAPMNGDVTHTRPSVCSSHEYYVIFFVCFILLK